MHYFYLGQNFCMELDLLDKRILTLLQTNARASLGTIGDEVGLSASACSRRLAQLEAKGAIALYRAELAAELFGLSSVAIVQVTLSSQSESALKAFERAINECRRVVTCDLMSGGVDYLVRILVADLNDYERLHREVLSALPGVARIQSNFVLRGIIDRQQARLL